MFPGVAARVGKYLGNGDKFSFLALVLNGKWKTFFFRT